MRRGVAGLAAAGLALGLLTGCGSPGDHVRDICGDVVTGTAQITRYRPDTPLTALQFARARFALVDKAVGAARETTLPADAADVLRTAWLTPAVASMADWNARLDALRAAADTPATPDHGTVDAAFGAALQLGTTGVDTAALKRAGYSSCAAAFTAPTVDATR